MLFLRGLLEPLATFLHVPTDGIVFVTLLLVGIVGHYSIYRVVKSLTVAADRTDTRWDDVVLYAIFPPIQWVMWVVLGLLSLSLFSALDGIREALMTLSDTAILLLVGWLAHRLSRGVEEELLGEHRGALESGERATISAVARPAKVHQVLVPLSTYPPSVGVAATFSLATSEPKSGSVTATAHSVSPEAIRGSQCFFCSSVPWYSSYSLR